MSQSQPLIAALTGQVTGRSPTQPQDCGQSLVFRRPAKHLQTTADFRLGRQVTLAQPSASSQGYRLRRADQSSSQVKAPGSTRSRPLVAAFTGQVTGRSPTQPQNCGQSPVFRRPAKHLQTTADFRLVRQVTLAQPSASSQGYRLRRADRSSSLRSQPQASVV